ncbi:MAG TPA: flagellar FlbD family protein [Paludibaculum sp.]|jgi:flagellar protein FlbD
MIRLTRINQSSFFLNADLIEFVETTPDTVVTTTNGQKVMVLEGAEEVVRRVEDYHRRVHPSLAGAVDSEAREG